LCLSDTSGLGVGDGDGRYLTLILASRTRHWDTGVHYDRLFGSAERRSGTVYPVVGRCARRNERMWRTASGMRSFGSFHGNMLTSAFGASIAASIATAYGWFGISSGRMRTGVWQPRTKSRVTV